MKTQHTPGLWRDTGEYILLEASKEMLAAIEAVANEHLNLRKLESHLRALDRAEEKLRSAIAKAEDRQ